MGQTALHLALRQGRLGIVWLLLENGANVDASDSDGSTPLHLAISAFKLNLLSQLGGLDIVRLLLENGANVDAPDSDGSTPLHQAISEAPGTFETYEDLKAFIDSKSLREVIELLLEYGASGYRKNNRDVTPFQVAAMRELYEITSLLSTSE
ncbi:ankyrin repeat protein [Russula emetica]|nr:ankyrin repeat protein [Russula emetica]